ncbi:hypothetical protein D7Y27_04780 [Corallococcus sp. AB004]|nr:hypothetical protein D7Y27_04780 [Corallococcus sp. AB004]
MPLCAPSNEYIVAAPLTVTRATYCPSGAPVRASRVSVPCQPDHPLVFVSKDVLVMTDARFDVAWTGASAPGSGLHADARGRASNSARAVRKRGLRNTADSPMTLSVKILK